MVYRIMADLVLLVHFGFILFVILGSFLVLRWPRIVWGHLPAAAWGAMIEFGGWICPLTPLENHLRSVGGAAGYGGGFIEHYLLPLVYPAGLTRTVQVVLGSAVVLVNLVGYGLVLARRFRAGGRAGRT